jgi:hypothetical protein
VAEGDVTFTKVAAAFEMAALFGGHMELTVQKSRESQTSFGVSVELNVDGDIVRRDANGAPVMDRTDPLDPQPRKEPGKVDAYRFMTFYLEPKTDHFEEFFNKVVDPIWINQSSHPAAVALRETRQAERKPPCWRVLHRVTFVSRVLPELAEPDAPPLEQAMRAANVESSYELIKKLDPFVWHATSSYADFADAVRGAIRRHLPELSAPAQIQAILEYLCLYYGVKET